MLNLSVAVWVFLIGATFVAVFMWMMFTEWSYLGPKFVRRSYDWLAPWYEGKWNSAAYQSDATNKELFIDPILAACCDTPDARLLDLACGTGRASLLMLRQTNFLGHIDAVDFSEGMLSRFRSHLFSLENSQSRRVHLTELDLRDWHPDQPNIYDAVFFLEASELIPELQNILQKISEGLKPGGVLVTTQVGRRFVWLFRGRHQKNNGMQKLLLEYGFEIIDVVPWRSRYDVIVAARKLD